MTSALKQNRLPPEKHEVTGCRDCPLSGWTDTGEALKCQHPDVTARDVTDEEGVPDFCPLLRAPLQLVIAGGGT